jgi:hypothetical protein
VTTRALRVTTKTKEAIVFAALAGGVETQGAIAERLGLSRERVSRMAAKHRAALDAEAAKTKQAALAGPMLARQKALEATPEAIDTMIEIMRAKDGLGDPINTDAAPVRLAAAKAICDRGGVPARTEIDATVGADPIRLARLAAMLRGG